MSGADQSMPVAERLLAIEEIKALCARYGLGLDTYDMDTILSVFTEDAIFNATAFGLTCPTGHDEIRSFFQHTLDVMSAQIHIFTNFIIDIDGPDSAAGSNYLYQDGYNQEGQQIRCLGHNKDRYRRADDGWKIAERVLNPLVMPQLEGFK